MAKKSRTKRSRERSWWQKLLGIGTPGPVELAEMERRAREEERFLRRVRKSDEELRRKLRQEERRKRIEEERQKREQRAEELRRLREERALALAHAALERARQKEEREHLKAERLREQAERAETRTRHLILTGKAESAERRERRLSEIASMIERGEYTPSELRDLMRRGILRVAPRTNPDDQEDLVKALLLSKKFHGVPTEVVELAPHERVLPRFVVALGEIPVITYEPDEHSTRGEIVWEHRSGDRGPFSPPSERLPVLAVDPRTRRPLIVPFDSPMRFDPNRGLVG